MNQDAPGSTPGVPRPPFRIQKRHFGEIRQLENWAIRAVSWHPRSFQKTAGPHLSGRQGGFKRRREPPHMVRSTLPPLRLSGGPQVDRTQLVPMHCTFFAKFPPFSSTPGQNQIAAGLSAPRRNSFDVQGTFFAPKLSRQSAV